MPRKGMSVPQRPWFTWPSKPAAKPSLPKGQARGQAGNYVAPVDTTGMSATDPELLKTLTEGKRKKS